QASTTITTASATASQIPPSLSHEVIKNCLIFQRCCFTPARRSFESERCRDPLYRMLHKSSKSGTLTLVKNRASKGVFPSRTSGRAGLRGARMLRDCVTYEPVFVREHGCASQANALNHGRDSSALTIRHDWTGAQSRTSRSVALTLGQLA